MNKKQKEAYYNNQPCEGLEKFECGDCGCYFWVENRNSFNCPNCFERITTGEQEGAKE